MLSDCPREQQTHPSTTISKNNSSTLGCWQVLAYSRAAWQVVAHLRFSQGFGGHNLDDIIFNDVIRNIIHHLYNHLILLHSSDKHRHFSKIYSFQFSLQSSKILGTFSTWNVAHSSMTRHYYPWREPPNRRTIHLCSEEDPFR